MGDVGHEEESRSAGTAGGGLPGVAGASGLHVMVPLVTYLRDAGVTSAALPPQAPAEVLLAEHRARLVRERGLASATVLRAL